LNSLFQYFKTIFLNFQNKKKKKKLSLLAKSNDVIMIIIIIRYERNYTVLRHLQDFMMIIYYTAPQIFIIFITLLYEPFLYQSSRNGLIYSGIILRKNYGL